MSRNTVRIALLVAVAAIGAMSIAATPASAFNFRPFFVNWVVAGSVTDKKIGQVITLPSGSTFNGKADIELLGLENIHGTITGTVFVPPFHTTLTVLGVPTPVEVAMTFNERGKVEGTVNTAPREDCGGAEGCVTVTAPTTAEIGLTGAFALGLEIPTHCETSEPITLPVSTNLTFSELVSTGAHAMGKATIPSWTCGGLEGAVLGPVLTLALSGPDNPFALSITPPKLKGR
jgi:hypothetical protein